MLQLRQSCEHCDKDLPPAARDAMICSFECTFCAACVELLFENVCPNCGGGFQRRPARPSQPHRPPWHLGEHPARADRVHAPKDLAEIRELQRRVKDIDPYAR
ncbi:MAG: DUF1272 domain-containing protein [Pseudomonadota bacterium]